MNLYDETINSEKYADNYTKFRDNFDIEKMKSNYTRILSKNSSISSNNDEENELASCGNDYFFSDIKVILLIFKE